MHSSFQGCWLKTDCQIFLQQRWVYSKQQRMAIRGLQPWNATCKSPRGNREEKEVGRAIANRVHGFSLAESLLGMRSSVSSSFLALLSSQQWELPLLVPHSIQLRFLFINFFFFLQVEGDEVLLSCFICQTVSMCLFVVYLVHIFCIFVDFVHDCTVSNDPQV